MFSHVIGGILVSMISLHFCRGSQVSSKTRKMTPCNHLHTINSSNVFKIREFSQNAKPVLSMVLASLATMKIMGDTGEP